MNWLVYWSWVEWNATKASHIVGCDLPPTNSLYIKRTFNWAAKIAGDPSHQPTTSSSFSPSGRRHRSIFTNTTPFKNSFFPTVIRTLTPPCLPSLPQDLIDWLKALYALDWTQDWTCLHWYINHCTFCLLGYLICWGTELDITYLLYNLTLMLLLLMLL